MADLPERIGPRAMGPVERIGPDDLFAYMDGAGELYLAYRFLGLDMVEYSADDAAPIVVEIYRMASSDDAFGLLSVDWGGEAVTLVPDAPAGWPPRALYGAGLLRLWAGDLFARVLAEQETPASREAVLAIGRVLAASRESRPAPALLREVPEEVGGLRLRRDQVTFLRSYLVLNSVVFLASRDVLALGDQVDGVAARYDGAGRPAWLLLLRYPDADAAGRGETAFRNGYLATSSAAVAELEDGWVGLDRQGKTLAIALACPDGESAQELAARALGRSLEKEDEHE